jgi:hypothetical protein
VGLPRIGISRAVAFTVGLYYLIGENRSREAGMDAPEQASDLEVLMKLRMEYLQALQIEDYGRINTVIVPKFLKLFGRYYDSYAQDWKNVSLLRLPVQVVIDPGQQLSQQLDWADQVLKGKIDLVL